MDGQAAKHQPDTATGFSLTRRVHIDALDLWIEAYEHQRTGATHLHLASDSDENVFMVALRTVPEDSTGVAHILEHTVLCGSERFPVRDPFFMMLRRSLNTFMNAFTSSDWTAYPFATQNRKDFSNLLSVYLDAVFFSRLDPLDFAQEGHRLEFEDGDPAPEKLVYKGVVFNEMKGAMSSIASVLWDRLCYELFPGNTYHFNSGGDPEVIPTLTYQQLRDFYQRHYHPSNAIFLTFGNIPAAEHQADFDALALRRFDRSEARIDIPTEPAFDAPRRAMHHYALDADESPRDKTHLVMGWKLGESADLEAMLEAQLVSAVLMENSASPLMHWLETTDLGSSPSPLCGLEDGMREMVLACGIEGSDVEHRDAFEAGVLAVIERVVAEGVEPDRLEAILHQIELHQREVTGDGMPYGLSLMLRALSPAVHYGDPIAALDLDPVIASIRARLTDRDYVPGLIRRLLLDNPHRVTLTVAPDTGLSAQRRAREAEQLVAIAEQFSPEQRAEVLDLAEKLRARQASVDDPDLLPRVELSDVPTALHEPHPEVHSEAHVDASFYTAGTNGLVYQQWAYPLPALAESDLERLPLYTALLPEIGIGTSTYLEVQNRHSATVGSLSAGLLTRGSRDDEQHCSGWLVLSSKALANRAQRQVGLMTDTLTGARFDELPRLRELVSQIRAQRDQSLTGNGHSLAMNAATAGMSPLARRSHEQTGLEGLRRLRKLDADLANDSELARFAGELATLHDRLQPRGGIRLATIADADSIDAAGRAAMGAAAGLIAGSIDRHWNPEPVRELRRELWVTNTQVNFCAMAFPTVPSGHPDAAVLTVLAAFLRNGFLHHAIREQGGAYGGGASHDANIAAFRFYSYRDPRLLETLGDFKGSIDWLLREKHEDRALEEAILGVIGALDKPASPAGEAKKHFHDQLFHRTLAHREAFRSAVLGTTLDDLRRVAKTYLTDVQPSVAVISSVSRAKETPELADAWQLTVRELL